MRNRIRHNYPSLIKCLRAFHILFFTYLLFRYYCYNHYKTQKYYFCYRYRYFHITLLLNTLLQILSYPGVVELTTQLLILENILWLPLCRINKFGLNTLPSKTVAIPYTCGLSYDHLTELLRDRGFEVVLIDPTLLLRRSKGSCLCANYMLMILSLVPLTKLSMRNLPHS